MCGLTACLGSRPDGEADAAWVADATAALSPSRTRRRRLLRGPRRRARRCAGSPIMDRTAGGHQPMRSADGRYASSSTARSTTSASSARGSPAEGAASARAVTRRSSSSCSRGAAARRCDRAPRHVRLRPLGQRRRRAPRRPRPVRHQAAVLLAGRTASSGSRRRRRRSSADGALSRSTRTRCDATSPSSSYRRRTPMSPDVRALAPGHMLTARPGEAPSARTLRADRAPPRAGAAA